MLIISINILEYFKSTVQIHYSSRKKIIQYSFAENQNP